MKNAQKVYQIKKSKIQEATSQNAPSADPKETKHNEKISKNGWDTPIEKKIFTKLATKNSANHNWKGGKKS